MFYRWPLCSSFILIEVTDPNGTRARSLLRAGLRAPPAHTQTHAHGTHPRHRRAPPRCRCRWAGRCECAVSVWVCVAGCLCLDSHLRYCPCVLAQVEPPHRLCYVCCRRNQTPQPGARRSTVPKSSIYFLRPWPVEGLGGLLGEGVVVDLREVGDAHVAVLAAARRIAVRREAAC